MPRTTSAQREAARMDRLRRIRDLLGELRPHIPANDQTEPLLAEADELLAVKPRGRPGRS